MRLKLTLSILRSFSPSPFPFLPFFLGVCFFPFFFLFSLVKSDFLHWGPHACFTNSSCLSLQPATVLWTTASRFPRGTAPSTSAPLLLPPAATLPCTLSLKHSTDLATHGGMSKEQVATFMLTCLNVPGQWEGSGSEALASNCYWREHGQRSWTQLSGHLQTPPPPFIVSVPVVLRTLPCLGVRTYCPAQDLLLHIPIVWPHSWMVGSGNFHCLQEKSSPIIREMMLLCGLLY